MRKKENFPKEFLKHFHGTGGSFWLTEEDGGPWVPRWWHGLIVIPLITILSYYLLEGDEGTFVDFAWALGIVLVSYFVFGYPLFWFRRYKWEKQQQSVEHSK